MIAKVLRGPRAVGLLRYLFGPGEENDHVNPRVVAGWDELHRITPTLGVDGRPDHRHLGRMLDATWRMAGMKPEDRPVYHVSVALARAVPEDGLAADPHLSDGQFAEVCRALIDCVGLGPCRWVAVRHDSPGETHAHVVATLASESGRRWSPLRGDFFRIGEVCREFEAKWNLRRTAPRDRTGPKRPTRGESEKSRRKGWRQSTRTLLRDQVRAVAGQSESVEDFMRRLAGEGVLVKWRLSEQTGQPTGYAVAIDRPSKDGSVDRVWFGGGRLASDLTLPKLRARWGKPVGEPPPFDDVDRDFMWARAVDAAREAAAAVWAFRADPRSASDAAWAASDFLASAARVVKGPQGKALREAAAGFERAGFEAFGKVAPPSRAGGGLRRAALLLSVARFVPDEDQQRLLLLLAQLAVLADAITRMREEQGQAVQAEAARRAALRLRATSPLAQPGDDEPLVVRAHEYARLRGLVL